jgi:hypothetical protein
MRQGHPITHRQVDVDEIQGIPEESEDVKMITIQSICYKDYCRMCNVEIVMTEEMYNHLRRTEGIFHCLNGHELSFPKKKEDAPKELPIKDAPNVDRVVQEKQSCEKLDSSNKMQKELELIREQGEKKAAAKEEEMKKKEMSPNQNKAFAAKTEGMHHKFETMIKLMDSKKDMRFYDAFRTVYNNFPSEYYRLRFNEYCKSKGLVGDNYLYRGKPYKKQANCGGLGTVKPSEGDGNGVMP